MTMDKKIPKTKEECFAQLDIKIVVVFISTQLLSKVFAPYRQ